MAGGYVVEEEEFWKCPKHPSRRRRTGVCHVCLRERLSSLCPECANPRPCHCCFSRSVAAPSVRSKHDQDHAKTIWSLFIIKSGSGSKSKRIDPDQNSTGTNGDVSKINSNYKEEEEEMISRRRRLIMMKKSRSMMAVTSDSAVEENNNNNNNNNNKKEKRGGWHFPSPIKVFKQYSISRGSIIVHQRSPLCS